MTIDYGSEHFRLSPIKAMEIAAAKIPGVISLAQGIPSFETPQAIKTFVQAKISEGACDKYSLTLGLEELREEIALNFSKEGLAYDPQTEIIATAGSIEGISASMLALTEPGDEVLLPSPTYVSYQGAIHLARCTPRFVPLDEDRNFDFDLDRFKEALTRRTKVILYCSPNNPTGTLYSEENTRRLIDFAEQHGLMVLVDEVYKDFYYTDDRHFSAVYIPSARKRVVRVCSFSKAYAMTGWRIGFLHSDAQNVARILKYHDAMVTCAPVVSQYAGIAALRFGEEYLEKFKFEYKARRDYAIQALDQLSTIIDYQVPKATYFVFPRIKDTVPLARDSTKLAYDILERAKVALVPGVAFGPSGESHLRINFGRDLPDLKLAMERLSEYFTALRSKAPSSIKEPHHRVTPEQKLSARSLSENFLAVCAKVYLNRTKPIIIGIVGSKGKTAVKRTLMELLGARLLCRGNILSYNTTIGLPASILGINPGQYGKAKLSFALRALARAFWGGARPNLLVLEYGMSSRTEGLRFLRMAPPDYLVVTPIQSLDPGVDCKGLAEGIAVLASGIPAGRIFWAVGDPWVDPLVQGFGGAGSLDPGLIKGSSVSVGGETWSLAREPAGLSNKLAIIAGITLALSLNIPKNEIQSYLVKQVL